MSVSDDEKRWMVVGLYLQKILASILRKYVENGFQKHYSTLDNKYHLKTLIQHTCSAHVDLANLKYGNIHSNASTHGKKKADLAKYNYSINNPVDLAKLYLPEYMTSFSGFDDSLDLSAMLRLLGFCRPPIFPSPTPIVSIQAAADDVRDDVRNKWGHCNLTEWTQAFYDDCFVTLEVLVGSLGLGSDEEKQLKNELKDWQSKGFDKLGLQLVQEEVKCLVQQSDKVLNQEFPDLKNKMDAMMNRLKQLENNVQEQVKKVERMEEHEQRVEGRMKEHEQKVEGRMHEHEQKVMRKIEEINQTVERATYKRKVVVVIIMETKIKRKEKGARRKTKTDENEGEDCCQNINLDDMLRSRCS